MATDDRDTTERAMCLRQMMNEFLRKMTAQERDRLMQVHLAQARGPAGNARALRSLTNALIRMRAARQASSSRVEDDSGESTA